MLTELTRKHMEENASLAWNQEAYQERYNDLLARYTAATERIRELTEIKEKRKLQQTILSAFADTMEKQEQTLNEFKEEFWVEPVEKAIVLSDHRMVFTFMNGAEIES